MSADWQTDPDAYWSAHTDETTRQRIDEVSEASLQRTAECGGAFCFAKTCLGIQPSVRARLSRLEKIQRSKK